MNMNKTLCCILPYGWNVRYRFENWVEFEITTSAIPKHQLQQLIEENGPLLSQTLEPNRSERDSLQTMHRWRQEGWGYKRIADEPNRLHVRTKRGYFDITRYKGDVRFTNGWWYGSTVRRMLDSQNARLLLREGVQATP